MKYVVVVGLTQLDAITFYKNNFLFIGLVSGKIVVFCVLLRIRNEQLKNNILKVDKINALKK